MLDPANPITRMREVVADSERAKVINASMDTRTASEAKRAARTESQENWRRKEKRLFNLVDVLIWINDT